MTDHEVSPEGFASRGCLTGILGVILFFGCVLGYAWFAERHDPLPAESARPTAPAAAPPADGGDFPDPQAVFAAFERGPDHCIMVYSKAYLPDGGLPDGVHEAWCHNEEAGCCNSDVIVDVYDSPAIFQRESEKLRSYVDAEMSSRSVGILSGRNWTLRGPVSFINRVRLWLGGTLLTSSR